MANVKYLDQNGLLYYHTLLKNKFVAQEAGKRLMTDAEGTKLAAIAENAQVNVIETVKVNGTALSVADKAVDVTVPTKVSDLNNDAGYITSADIPEGVAASNATPQMATANGSAGVENTYARADHAHPSDTSKVDKTTTVNGKALSANIELNYEDVGAVPTTRTVNGKALSTDITLGYGDVGAAAEGHVHDVATQSANGFMSATDKAKLDGIEEGANKYVLPNATASVLGGVTVGDNISVSEGKISVSKTNVTNALGYTPPTPAEMTAAIANAGHLKRSIVSALPEVASADTNTIYMVLEDSANANSNKYVEYMVVEGVWEKIGTSDVDLTDYAKTEDFGAISNTEIDEIVAS